MGILENKKILIVDDEKDIRSVLKDEFELEDATVIEAENGLMALEVLKNNQIDFIVSDVKMPIMGGDRLLDEVRKLNPLLPKVILVTGFADLTESDAIRRGAEKMFHKPFDPVLISTYIAEKLNSGK